jgi:hypothetical protein
MGKMQRNKGSQFEREVCDLFTSALNPDEPFKRNIGQARDGGNDIDVGPLVVECKRRKTLGTVYGWLQQAIEAVRGRALQRYPKTDNHFTPMIPIVVARQDGDTAPIVILRLSDFLILTRDELRAHITEDAA